MHVDALHVAARQRGRGIGGALLAAVSLSAKGQPVWLEVLEGNASARAVYAAWGGDEGPVFEDVVLGAVVPARRVTWADSRRLADPAKGRARR
ncbi:acetyltransferase (GNAT) family protein [Roseicyclus mahoneyensis]|uniref:Acetyltransferase (GNAT) family protein n=1 Tax=Roseicyclus mahoneyensis TaxID=164332 RepID=A0A316GRQ8_9RHOB|nr:acetyltransferase (GNAT) family protein [Roseicyclus mahoneyensis]